MGTGSASRARWSEAEAIITGLADLVGAGFSLNQSIEILGKDSKRRAAVKLREDLLNGSTFSESLRNRFYIGDHAVLAQLEAGEKAGNIVTAIREAGAMIRARQSLHAQVSELLFYPRLVTLCVVLLLNSLVLLFIPAMQKLFTSLNLSTSTNQMWVLGQSWAVWVLLPLNALILTFVFNPKLSRMLVPLGLKRSQELSWFFTSLEGLLSAGVSLSKAIDTLAHVSAYSPVLFKSVCRLSSKLSSGSRLSEAMAEDSKYWTYTCVVRIGTAEAAGQLREGVTAVADNLKQQKASSMASMLNALRVASIVGLGLAVYAVTYSVYRPLMDTITQLSGL